MYKGYDGIGRPHSCLTPGVQWSSPVLDTDFVCRENIY